MAQLANFLKQRVNDAGAHLALLAASHDLFSLESDLAKENLAKKAKELDEAAQNLLAKINRSLQASGDSQAKQAVKDAIDDTKKGYSGVIGTSEGLTKHAVAVANAVSTVKHHAPEAKLEEETLPGPTKPGKDYSKWKVCARYVVHL